MLNEECYLVKMVIDAAPSHEFEDNAEVWLLGAGSDKLDHIPVPDLPHYGNFLRQKRVVSVMLLCAYAVAQDNTPNLLPHLLSSMSSMMIAWAKQLPVAYAVAQGNLCLGHCCIEVVKSGIFYGGTAGSFNLTSSGCFLIQHARPSTL